MTTAVTSHAAASVTNRSRLAVAGVFAASGMLLASWVSRIPAVRDALGLSAGDLGLVLLVMALGAVLALPSAGAVVSRLGAAATVRAAALVCTVGLAVAALAPDVPVLVAGLFLMGLGFGAWDVAMNVEGAEVERRGGRSLMPHLHAGFSVGAVAGALLGAALNAAGISTTVHLVAVCVLVAVSTSVACRAFLPAAPGGEQALGRRRHPLAAWRESRTLLIGVLVFAFALAEGSASDWLAVALVDGYHLSHAGAVLGFALFVAAMTLGRLLGTRLLDRFGRVGVLRASALLAAAGLLLVILGGSPVVAAVGSILWGLGAALGFPVGMSAGADDPQHAAARVSVVASIGYTAFLGGPPLIGFLADRVGVPRALGVVVVVLVLGLLAAGATRPLTTGAPA